METRKIDVKGNLARVRERIAEAAFRAGRSPEEIRLVAATKGVDTERIREAMEAGVEILGENYVQEARRKYEEIGSKVRWHMIGHLQTNKAKYVARFFECVHSVDSLRLAQELDRRAVLQGRTIDVLIQVNLSGEETKSGVAEEEVEALAEGIAGLEGLRLVGLMTMPPFSPDPEDSRPYFVALRRLKERLNERGFPLKELSMGMSADFEVAIEEGATMVRIGTAIFGPRG